MPARNDCVDFSGRSLPSERSRAPPSSRLPIERQRQNRARPPATSCLGASPTPASPRAIDTTSPASENLHNCGHRSAPISGALAVRLVASNKLSARQPVVLFNCNRLPQLWSLPQWWLIMRNSCADTEHWEDLQKGDAQPLNCDRRWHRLEVHSLEKRFTLTNIFYLPPRRSGWEGLPRRYGHVRARRHGRRGAARM